MTTPAWRTTCCGRWRNSPAPGVTSVHWLQTPHIVFDSLIARSPLPLLSIVEVCAAEVRARSFSRVGLLGTGFTMEAGFYPETFGRFGIDVVVPDASNRGWLHEHYLGELLKGVFKPETRSGVTAIVQRLVEQHQIQAIVLAGTELPLLLNSSDVADVPLLDTTELHVKAIVQRLKSRKAEAIV